MEKLTKRRGRPPKTTLQQPKKAAKPKPSNRLPPIGSNKNQIAYQALCQRYSKGLIADFAGVSPQALTKWSVVPANRAMAISTATGIPLEELRPDPYSIP
jgi:hypothetical protein